MTTFDKQKAREAAGAFDDGQQSALAVAGHLPAALDRIDELESAANYCVDVTVFGLAAAMHDEKSSALRDIHARLRAVLAEGSDRPQQTPQALGPRHKARLKPWSPAELRSHLVAIVDGMSVERHDVSPLDIALQLLGGELEAFVLFGRVGHLDPPREDGKVPIAILQHESDDPEIDARIRDVAKKWAAEQEKKS